MRWFIFKNSNAQFFKIGIIVKFTIYKVVTQTKTHQNWWVIFTYINKVIYSTVTTFINTFSIGPFFTNSTTPSTSANIV